MTQPAAHKATPFRLRGELSWLCLLFALSLMVRLLYVIPMGFDGLYGQDAYAYYDFAQVMRQAATLGKPLEPFFWPLGYPALLAAGFSVFGSAPGTGLAINLIMGSALSPLVYVLARQSGLSRGSASLSALVMMVCGQAIQSSIVVMSDIPALFWATLSGVMLLRYVRPEGSDEAVHRPFWLAIAAALLALASVTRWLYLVLFIPWFIAVLMRWRGRVDWRAFLSAATAAGVVFLPQLVYSRTNPAPTLNHAWVEGWSPANALQSSFTNIDGHFEYQKINALFYAQPFYEAYYLSPLLTPLLMIGAWWAARRKGEKEEINHRGTEIRQRAVIFVGWALLPYLFLVGIPYQNIRFPLIVFPAVAVLLGHGFEWVIERGAGTRIAAQYGRLAGFILIGIAIAGIGQTFAAASSTINQFITNQQRDKTTALWAGGHVPEDAALYTFGLTLTLKHYTTLDVYELYYETPQTLAAKWQRGREDYLLINVWNIENQWQGREPQLNYHWLRDERGLTEIGKTGYYTLFRIGG